MAPRRVRFHDLRHTYATLRVAKGDNIVDISNQLGHHDPGFTLKAYAHWLLGEHKSQVDELDDLAPKRTLSAPCGYKPAWLRQIQKSVILLGQPGFLSNWRIIIAADRIFTP